MENDQEIKHVTAPPETVVIDAKEHSTLLINLEEVKSNTKAIRKNTESLERLVKWTGKGIIITIILSAAAIVVSIVH